MFVLNDHGRNMVECSSKLSIEKELETSELDQEVLLGATNSEQAKALRLAWKDYCDWKEETTAIFDGFEAYFDDFEKIEEASNTRKALEELEEHLEEERVFGTIANMVGIQALFKPTRGGDRAQMLLQTKDTAKDIGAMHPKLCLLFENIMKEAKPGD